MTTTARFIGSIGNMTTVSDAATAHRCQGTPVVTVVDNRGLTVRTVQYNRSSGDDPIDELVSRQTWSVRGHLDSSIDPRLFDEQRLDPAVPPNFRYVRSLSGQPLAVHSQDAGARALLHDIMGGIAWQHNSRDQQLRRTYDQLHRVVSVTEQAGLTAPRVSERFVYGDATASPDANLRGKLLQAWSPAGLTVTPAYDLASQPLTTRQQFLRDDVLDSDWTDDDPAAWAGDLAPDTYTSRWAYNALGQVVERTDARGNRQRQRFDVAGQLATSDLQLAGQSTWQPLLRTITYSAAGQVLHEAAGNGVVTDYTYEPQTQRLAELRTTRPTQSGRSPVLQALSYQYDPIGNLLAIEDAAKATRYTRNQRVAPASHYTYDALYQLTRATGRENANAGRQSQALPPPIVPLFQEIGELTNYTRTYAYDRGANLTTMRHQGATPYTQQMVVARTSNHAVPQTHGLTPGDVNGYFDACGNLKELGPGQLLGWDSRNQLQRTTQIVRSGDDDDTEMYWYDGAGQRATKLATTKTSGTTRTERVRYLPGLELRQTEQTYVDGGQPFLVEFLQVLTLGAAGRQSVRVLHWVRGKPPTIENDQQRYSLDDQIGSSMLELDAQADVLTWEEYYPYGGTAVWSARSDSEAKYKYVRYSGQERDATGLYYYGLRYYAAWLGRWINPDPAGLVDGLNLFCMVANNPISMLDEYGLFTVDDLVNEGHPLENIHLAYETTESWEAYKSILRDLFPSIPESEFSELDFDAKNRFSLSPEKSPEFTNINEDLSDANLSPSATKNPGNPEYNAHSSTKELIRLEAQGGKLIFRGDTRPPCEIFTSGFQARGMSDKLADYVQQNIDSIFVSFTSEEKIARIYANQMGSGGWVYVTENPQTGIDVNSELRKHGSWNGRGYRFYEYAKEIAVPRGISSTNIREAYQVDHFGKYTGERRIRAATSQ
ncbi:RHS repeat-associated core domain-containing protein [Burkholderia sp. S-53]|uniref:RHS repeat-associated core domain-containing protein n=1 Tax=Burkholderia sp. S-53 TaxID=2906514 RepID=UPI0021CEA6B8|nr:RHS repeat-associated core domain-containing protein [Burkholderia sp. S-53]UXU86140.1 RHS repeat protein [Burkholderia sp. S-53]